MRPFHFFVLLLIFFCVPATPAHADCANPSAAAGQVVYNGSYNTPQYCDGSTWIAFGSANAGAGSGGCSNPTGPEGQVLFSSGSLRFCNGASWIGVGKKSGGGSAPCTNPSAPAGTLVYNPAGAGGFPSRLVGHNTNNGNYDLSIPNAVLITEWTATASGPAEEIVLVSLGDGSGLGQPFQVGLYNAAGNRLSQGSSAASETGTNVIPLSPVVNVVQGQNYAIGIYSQHYLPMATHSGVAQTCNSYDANTGGMPATLGYSNWTSCNGAVQVYARGYSSGNGMMQYCDGAGWMGIGKRVTPAPVTPTIAGFQVATSVTSADSISMAKPAGVTNGELLLLIVGDDDTGAGPEFSNNVTDWNFVGTGGNASAQAHIAVYWRVADGTEPASVTVNPAGTGDDIFGWYIRIAGANTSTPIDTYSFGVNTWGGDPYSWANELTTTMNGTLGIFGLSFDGADGDPFTVGTATWAQSAPWTKADETQAGTSGTNAGGVWGYRPVLAAGSSAVAYITASANDTSAFFQLAIRPAP